jgi:outer membrane immunogenic protein
LCLNRNGHTAWTHKAIARAARITAFACIVIYPGALAAMNVRLLTAAVALGLAPLAANADGLPSAPAPVAANCCAYVPPPDWSGYYAGFHLGGVWSERNWSFPFAESFNTAAGQGFSLSADGAVIGGQLGFNYQITNILVGGEVTGAFTDLEETRIGPLIGAPLNRFKISSQDLFTVAGRLGYVHDKFLFYGKGGYANAGVDVSAINTGITAGTNQRMNGWTVGGGIEMRLYSEILFGIEYNFIDFSGDRFTGFTTGSSPGLPFHADINDIHTQSVVARLSVLFGPNACCNQGLIGKY